MNKISYLESKTAKEEKTKIEIREKVNVLSNYSFKKLVFKKLMSSEQTQKELLNFIRSLQKQVRHYPLNF